MASIHTSGYYFEVDNVTGGWNNGVSRFHYVSTQNTDEHIYSFNYNASASYVPTAAHESIYFKPGFGWYDLSSTSNPFTITSISVQTSTGITEGTNSAGGVMMKWGHSGFPDPTKASIVTQSNASSSLTKKVFSNFW